MTTPTFNVSSESDVWLADSDAPGLADFECWDGGNHIVVLGYLGDLPTEIELIDVAGWARPIISHNPEAFAAYLTGRYSIHQAIEALHTPWAAQVEQVGRGMRRHLTAYRVRRLLRRLQLG